MLRSLKTTGVAVAAIAAASVATASEPAKAPVEARSADGKTVVTAQDTRVDVDHNRGKVRVEAPYTSVKVDPDARFVKIRVPYFNGDIRW